MVVALLGPDGSGKSTVLDLLSRRVSPVFRVVRRVHFRPQWGRASSESGGQVVADPHGQAPRGAVGSLLKLAYYLLDYTIGMARLYFSCKMRSGLLLFDRYAQDIEVDPRRYRYGGPLWAARLLGRLVPQPDLVFVLTGDPGVLWRRKKEVPLGTLTALCQKYEQVARREGWTIVDAATPLEDVVEKVEGAVLCHLERRLAKRMGWKEARSDRGR